MRTAGNFSLKKQNKTKQNNNNNKKKQIKQQTNNKQTKTKTKQTNKKQNNNNNNKNSVGELCNDTMDTDSHSQYIQCKYLSDKTEPIQLTFKIF